MTDVRSRTTLRLAAGAVCVALLALPVPAAQAADAARTADDHPATRAALETFQAKAGPGAAVHAGDGTDAWTLSAGTGTVGADRPLQADEHIRAGSQTKTFTAAVILQLADEGEVNLDSPIEDYLPGLVTGNGYDGTRITVRHLLQHTGGVAAFAPDPLINAPAPNPDGTYDPAALVRMGLQLPPVAAPGEDFTYSNTNYLILDLLIEQVTGTPVHTAAMERIVEPLGLTRTVFPAPGDRVLPAPAVNGYHGIRVGGLYVWVPALSFDPSLFGGSGALISTLEDLTAFYRALTAGEVLSPAALEEMRNVQVVNDAGSGYGLGLMRLDLSCGGVAWGHTGGILGYQTATLVTGDGRHASAVTNALFQVNRPDAELRTLLDTALCEDQPQDS
ncbi:serine hydrolase domain-containing protein [Streptomyces xiamenensis]|uniref:serine hydrolase domain-containing protein n=1 Tax=Streptomyces xiamenensis TaxID=408015 RepID=UPI0036E760EA